jgi:deazaflavin-dependent oxidoreductase (nitroreductase family)
VNSFGSVAPFRNAGLVSFIVFGAGGGGPLTVPLSPQPASNDTAVARTVRARARKRASWYLRPPAAYAVGGVRSVTVNRLAWKLWHQFTQAHVRAYRLSGGRIGGSYHGSPVLLLDHVGRKTGRKHTSPLIYARDGDDLAIVASKGGSHKNPVWWLNLKGHPETTVQVGSEKRRVVARRATAEEKKRLWRALVEIYPPYESYQRRSSRDIPVIVLERRD